MNHSFTSDERDMLLVWSEYGERPFDGIIEMECVPKFLNMLHRHKVSGPLYRGTRRHSELKVDDIFQYTYPTSWSLDDISARRFIDGIPGSTLLIIPEGEMFGVENTESFYSQEIEAILAPMKMIVSGRFIDYTGVTNITLSKMN